MTEEIVGTHRRKTDEIQRIHVRLNDAEDHIAALIESDRKMSETLEKLSKNIGRVAEVLEAFNNAKGAWVTVKFLSEFTKLLLPIAAFFGILWAGVTIYWSDKP